MHNLLRQTWKLSHILWPAYTKIWSLLQSLNAAVEEANAEKVAAQQSLHDLKLKVREMNARRLSPRDSRGPENSSVLNKIMTMEDKTQSEWQYLMSILISGRTPQGWEASA